MSSLNVGDLVAAHVFDIRPMLVRITSDGQSGVIRGGAAERVKVGQIIKVLITENNGVRFEATLVHP